MLISFPFYNNNNNNNNNKICLKELEFATLQLFLAYSRRRILELGLLLISCRSYYVHYNTGINIGIGGPSHEDLLELYFLVIYLKTVIS